MAGKSVAMVQLPQQYLDWEDMDANGKWKNQPSI